MLAFVDWGYFGVSPKSEPVGSGSTTTVVEVHPRGVTLPHSSFRERTWSHAAGVLTFAVAAVLAVRGAALLLRRPKTDFAIYHDAARALLAGRNPFEVEGYIYLPSFALLMTPLGLLPYAAAALVWTALSAAALTAAVCSTARIIGRGPNESWPLWLPLLCVLRPVDSGFAYGQANLIVLGCLLAGVAACLAGRELRAGAWIALAAALKILPVALLAWFALRGSWRAVLAGGAGVLLLTVFLPAATCGWERNLEWLGTWWTATAGPFLAGGDTLLEARPKPSGQSLMAATYRLLSDVPATPAGDRANLLDLSPATVDVVFGVALALLAGTTCAVLALGLRGRAESAGAPGAAAILTFVLLAAPMIHKAHLVWLILPVAVQFDILLRRPPPGWKRGAHAALLLVAVACIGLTTPALIGRAASTRLLTFNVVFFGVLLIHALSLYAVRGAPPRFATSRTQA